MHCVSASVVPPTRRFLWIACRALDGEGRSSSSLVVVNFVGRPINVSSSALNQRTIWRQIHSHCFQHLRLEYTLITTSLKADWPTSSASRSSGVLRTDTNRFYGGKHNVLYDAGVSSVLSVNSSQTVCIIFFNRFFDGSLLAQFLGYTTCYYMSSWECRGWRNRVWQYYLCEMFANSFTFQTVESCVDAVGTCGARSAATRTTVSWCSDCRHHNGEDVGRDRNEDASEDRAVRDVHADEDTRREWRLESNQVSNFPCGSMLDCLIG